MYTPEFLDESSLGIPSRSRRVQCGRKSCSTYIHVFFDVEFKWTETEVRFDGFVRRLQTNCRIDISLENVDERRVRENIDDEIPGFL